MKTIVISPNQLVHPPESIALRPAPTPDDKDWNEVLIPLKNDIEKNGLMDLFSVTDAGDGKYMVLNGNRRATALKLLCEEGHPDFQKISVQLTTAQEYDALERQIAGNATVKSTKPGQYIQAIQKLFMARQYTVEQLAERIGKSPSYVANLLKINKLPEYVNKALNENKLSVSNAIQLTRLPTAEEIEEKFEQACSKSGADFATLIEEHLKDKAEERRAERTGQASEFNPEAKFIGKEKAYMNFERARNLIEEEDNEVNRAYFRAYQEIFQMDEVSIQKRRSEWEAKKAEKERKKEEQKKKREEKKREEAAKLLKSAGINDLSQFETDEA